MADEVALIVDGQKFTNWESVGISQSLTQIAGSFEFVVSSKWPTDWASNYGIYMGAKCEVTVNDYQIINGYIDQIPIRYSSNNYSISYAGRDKTADLVDSCFDIDEGKNELKNQTPYAIISKLCSPFDIQVYGDIDVLVEMNDWSKPIESYTIEVGTPIYEQISRLCQAYAVLPYTKGDGVLWLGRAGVVPSIDSLEGGVNIKSASFRTSDRNRFQKYYAKGVQGEAKTKTDVLKSDAIEDVNIARERVLVVVDENLKTIGSCNKRAAWEASIRAGKSGSLGIEVQGWTQSNGWPWMLNSVVPVYDQYLGIGEPFGLSLTRGAGQPEDWLIDSIDFSLDNTGGSIANLGLVMPDTYKIQKVKTTKKVKKDNRSVIQKAVASGKIKVPGRMKTP